MSQQRPQGVGDGGIFVAAGGIEASRVSSLWNVQTPPARRTFGPAVAVPLQQISVKGSLFC